MTTLSRDPSVDELRHESERSRAALASTISELKEKVSDTTEDVKTRLSPSHIKQEVKDYVRGGSEQFFYSIERKARDNPLQAVAIGAGIVYPLWGLLKTIPVPIVLVGAGLWLSTQKNGRYAQDIADRVSEAGASGANRVAESVRDTGASLGTSAIAATEKVRATAHDVRDSVADMGQRVAGVVKEQAADARDSVLATVSVLRDKEVRLGNQSRHAFEDFVYRNPLLVAGFGLAIGGFIAASLPTSDVENRLFGERSDEVKDKALDAASNSLERAKDVAAGVVGDVSAAAAREGLTVESLAKAVEGVTEGVKSVLDKGINTALGEDAGPLHSQDRPNQQKRTNGEI
jgi:ElaB/YqjD/DUF883 family membrane-anchored ribosome-binding protein